MPIDPWCRVVGRFAPHLVTRSLGSAPLGSLRSETMPRWVRQTAWMGSERLRVYTDGACSGNPGPGGWAWASSRDHFGSGGDPATTNNKMELTAVLRAIESNPGPLTVVMDSTYVKDGLEKWSINWIKNGWMTKAKEPVKNREIWEPLIAARDARRDEITFEWVKGHSGDRMNDLV